VHRDFVEEIPHDKLLRQTSMGLLLESKLDSARIPAVDWTIHVQKFGQSLLALSVEEESQKSCPSLASQWQLVQQIDLHQHLQKLI